MIRIELSPIKYRIFPVALLALLSIMFSCKRATEKTSEKIIEKSIGKDADVNIKDDKVVIETEEGTFTTDAGATSWPREIPEEVPPFPSGKVISSSKQEVDEANNWVVIFEEVSENALEKYRKALENNGFKIEYTTTAGSGGHLAAAKGEMSVLTMVGDGNATVTVSTRN